MKVAFIPPIDYCIGKVSMKSEFYFRRNKYGKVFVQRCPRRLSEKQKAWNKQFARLYAGRHHNKLQRGMRIQTLPQKQMRGILQGKQTVQQYMERNSARTAMPTCPTTAVPTPTTGKPEAAKPIIQPPRPTSPDKSDGIADTT